MDSYTAAVLSAAYVLIAVRVYIVVKRKGQSGGTAFYLSAVWPATMAIIGVVVPLSGETGIYGERQ